MLALLATVVFDGLRSTIHYARLEADLIGLLPRLDDLMQTRWTIMMILIVAHFRGDLSACVGLRLAAGERVALEIARRYASTLIPIAAVYFIAHYALYLFYLAADPACGARPDRFGLDPRVQILDGNPRQRLSTAACERRSGRNSRSCP